MSLFLALNNKINTNGAVTPPSNPVPVPNGITGTLFSLQTLTIDETSSTEFGVTTISGKRSLKQIMAISTLWKISFHYVF